MMADTPPRIRGKRRWSAHAVPSSSDDGTRGAPERRLLLAVLTDALQLWLDHYRDGTPSGRRLFAEVDAWFRRVDRGAPFAFENVCDMLDVDARRVRTVLSSYRIAAPEADPAPDDLLQVAVLPRDDET